MEATVLPDLNTPVRGIARNDVPRLLDAEQVGRAVARLRAETAGGEGVLYFYVTNADGVLVGVVPTRRLLLSDPSATVREVMVGPVVAANESDAFRDALQTLLSRKLLALPVVDDSRRLTGILDLSMFTQTLLDLERRETADELFQLAGVHVGQDRSPSLASALSNRFPWLTANIASGLAAAAIADSYRGLLQAVVALAFFVPLLLTIAESIAMQSVTMSLSQLQLSAPAERRSGALREICTGLLLGLGSGLIVGFSGAAWLSLYRLAGVVACAILMAGAIGAGFGFFVPRLVRRWKLDPVVASGPATLALTDVAALAVYFGIAGAVLA